MGNDGGSIPYRRDLVKNKPKAEQKDEKSLLRAIWFYCALSKKPLTIPVVADPLGKLYNKEAIIEFLLDRSSYGDGDQICGYVKGVKDLLNLVLTPNPAATTSTPPSNSDFPPSSFICPLTLKEMSGSLPFVALRSCGCVFSEAGLKSVVGSVTGTTTPPSEGEDEGGRTVPCPNCNKPFNPAGEKGKSAWLQLNPKAEVQEKLLEDLLAERAAAKLNKQKDKEANGGKKRKSTAANLVDGSNHHDASKRSKTSGSQQPQASTQSHLSSKIQHQLQELEDKRKAGGMSAAVQSIYAGKGGEKKGSNNDFFTRTFTRYA